MFKPLPPIALVICLASLPCAGAQTVPSGPAASQSRRPFANPGTPRQTERIRTVDIKHIKAELTLDAKAKSVRGTVTHTFSPLHPFLNKLELDCGPRLKVSRIRIGPMDAPCAFTTSGEKLSITLDQPYGPANTLDLVIAYEGTPENGLHFILPDPAYPEKPTAIWTQGEAEDTHHWLPCYDYPNERVTTEMIITVAKPLSVVSNGILVATKDNPDQTTTYHWKMDQPHSSYLITVAASEFKAFHDKVGDLPVDYYVTRNVDEATARRFMGRTPEMIRFFAEKVGHPYPYPKYAQVCMPEFGGGMENSSATSMTDSALHDEIEALERDEDGLVAHELAHQWFGDLLTCKDWSNLWLNEGFASYFDPLYFEFARGEDEFRMRMNEELQGYLGNDRSYRRPIVEARFTSPMQMFDGMTYAKGGCVLHMLRGLLGDEAWWRGIRGYVARHKFQLVETDDFRKAMEEASGKDLKWFFDQWLFKAGHPELKVRSRYEEADQTVRVTMAQTQKLDEQTPLFRLPTTVELTDAEGKTRSIPIVIDGATHEFVIPAATRPRLVQFDPRSWIIKELDFEKSVDENLYQLAHATSVLARLDAARALVKEVKGKPEVGKTLTAAWTREKSVSAKTRMVEVLADGEESFRPALNAAVLDPEARVRVAACRGLARLTRDEAGEKALREAWANPKEAYGARKAALEALVGWKVKDADHLLSSALSLAAGKHTLAATALELMLKRPGPKARELAALYTRYGQPRPLRSTAVGAIERLAEDDSSLQDMIIPLVEDPDRMVRFRAWGLIRSLKLKKALPLLEARRGREGYGFMGFSERQLEETIKALKEGESAASSSPPTSQAKTLAELERKAVELEKQARELRDRIEALKPKTPASH